MRPRFMVCCVPGGRWAVAEITATGEQIVSEHDNADVALRECQSRQAGADDKETRQ